MVHALATSLPKSGGWFFAIDMDNTTKAFVPIVTMPPQLPPSTMWSIFLMSLYNYQKK
jgi:hypothetical protein